VSLISSNEANHASSWQSDPSVAAYSPIRDYALIGDCHGCALVSRAGGIDWCAFGRFDAPPVFCRILDANKGGCFSITPSGPFETARSYLEGTNILRTVFETDCGSVAVTDYKPVGHRRGAGVHDYVSLAASGLLIRVIEGLSGRVALDIDFRPSVDYARKPVRLSQTATGCWPRAEPHCRRI
jgi:alpha,alpha-trehalase